MPRLNSFKLPDLERCARCGRSFDESQRHILHGALLCNACVSDDMQQLTLWPIGVDSGLAPADAKKKQRRR